MNCLIAGIYFSAHWCPPCRGFTPTLAEFYNKLKAARPGELEIVFVSFDRDEEGFKDYYGSMPWLSVDFANKELRVSITSCTEIMCQFARMIKLANSYIKLMNSYESV